VARAQVKDGLAQRYHARFGRTPRIFQAPGRINIIGEHTDYSGGLVLPAAIDKSCFVAAAANGTRMLRVVSDGFPDAEADLDALVRSGTWIDYVAGVASILARAGIIVPGADLLIASGVPVGAGVSSSAALEVAVAHALLALADRPSDRLQIARWAQAAENEFVGMPCGIMDQFASANGMENGALLLDCATLVFQGLELPHGASFLVVDSMVRHTHVDGEYRSRREDCETAARLLGLDHLSAVDENAQAQALSRLPERIGKRARHVASENTRVVRAVDAIRRFDLAALGELMNQSHASLRDDMEVSVPEVDTLAAIAQQTPGVYGARMMGGGFGGSVIALAATRKAENTLTAIRTAYETATGKLPNGFVCKVVAGAGEVSA
jgi:galactokinase